jgi:hypothetical protein
LSKSRFPDIFAQIFAQTFLLLAFWIEFTLFVRQQQQKHLKSERQQLTLRGFGVSKDSSSKSE